MLKNQDQQQVFKITQVTSAEEQKERNKRAGDIGGQQGERSRGGEQQQQQTSVSVAAGRPEAAGEHADTVLISALVRR